MKTVWKKLTAAALCAAVLLTPALAALKEGEKFPTVNAYPGYGDVKESDWFYDNAKLCYEIGVMTGTDKGFEPDKVLTEAECVTLAARVGATLRGEPIRDKTDGEAWWVPYNDYLFPDGGSIDFPDEAAGRWQLLIELYDYVDEAGLLKPINNISKLPDTNSLNEAVALKYYNAGILTGMDKYGTLGAWKSLTRAEAAAMISRIVRPELRKTFVPADYSPFTAASLTPETAMFSNGLTAEEYLTTVNNAITAWEDALGEDFNWHYVWSDGKTVLSHVKEDPLTALGVTEEMGTQAYKDFDVQVYYSKLIDLMGGPLGAGSGDEAQSREADKGYTLTAVTLPVGWVPTADSNNVAAGWAGIQRVENGQVVEEGILRADGTVMALNLDGYSIYGFEGPVSRGDATRLWVRKDGSNGDYLWNIYDVEQGKLLLVRDIPDGSPDWDKANETWFPAEKVPKVLWEDASPYAVDADGAKLPFRQYSELHYLGDGMFNYWGEDWNTDCGLVDMNGAETPTATFSGWFNGGLSANHGLIAMGHESGMNWVMAYYDYAGNQVSEDFDWAGPIGDDGAGSVCRDGALCRIQF